MVKKNIQYNKYDIKLLIKNNKILNIKYKI